MMMLDDTFFSFSRQSDGLFVSGGLGNKYGFVLRSLHGSGLSEGPCMSSIGQYELWHGGVSMPATCAFVNRIWLR